MSIFKRNKKDVTEKTVSLKNLYLAETGTHSSSSKMGGVICVNDLFIVEERHGNYYELFSGVELELNPFNKCNDEEDLMSINYFDVPYIEELTPVQKYFKVNKLTIRELFFFLNEMATKVAIDNEYERTHPEKDPDDADPNDVDDFEEDTDEEPEESSDSKEDSGPDEVEEDTEDNDTGNDDKEDDLLYPDDYDDWDDDEEDEDDWSF